MRRCRQVIAAGAVIMVAGLALLRAGAAPGCGRGLAGARPARQRPRDRYGPRPGAVTVLARVTPQHGRPAAGVLSTVQ
jgi:rRNA maturation protein Nop10